MGARSELLREPDFRRLFFGGAISFLGDRIVPVALAFAVLDLTGSAAALGLVLAARTAPTVVFLLAGGVFADRLPRRAVMIAADLVRLVSQGAMGALLISGHAEVWLIAVLAAIGGTAAAFFVPASTGLLPAVVAPERLQLANGLRGLAMSVGEIGGPIIGGLLVVGVGAGWAIAADAATFAVSALFLVRLRTLHVPPVVVESFITDLRAGWSAFRVRRWLVATTLMASLSSLTWTAFGVLGPVVANDELGGAPAWALIYAALGAGSVGGSLLMLRVEPRHPTAVASVAVAVFSLPLAFIAAPAPVALIAVAAFAGGGGLVVANTLWETTIQRHVPGELLSRVSAYDLFGSMACQPIGYVIWGPLAVVLGTGTALWLAFVLMFGAALAVLGVREIRELPPYPAARVGRVFSMHGDS